MKNKILFSLLCILPMTANAAIPYRVEQINMPPEESVSGYDAEAFARDYRFYVGGMYTFSMWDNGADDAVSISGKNTSSFDVVAGIRLFDIFRLEANYAHTAQPAGKQIQQWNGTVQGSQSNRARRAGGTGRKSAAAGAWPATKARPPPPRAGRRARFRSASRMPR